DRLQGEANLEARGHEPADEGGPQDRLPDRETPLTKRHAQQGRPPQRGRAVEEIGEEPLREERHQRLPRRRGPVSRRRRTASSAASISFSRTRWATSALGSPPKSLST